MNQKHIATAQKRLDEAVSELEGTRNKQITPSARIMLQAILMESLTTRETEWFTRKSIVLEAYGSEDALGRQIKESFAAILYQAYLEQKGDYITTRDLLAAIHNKWCGVFPIC